MSAWHITLKDIKLLINDRRALVLLLVLPLLFISIVGMSTGQFLTGDDTSDQFKIVYVDKSQTETSRGLIAEIEQTENLVAIPVASADDAVETMRNGTGSMYLMIGPRFEELVEDLRMSDIFNPKTGLTATGPSTIDLTISAKRSTAGLGKLLETVLFTQVVRYVIPIAAKKNPVTRSWVRASEEDEERAQSIKAKAAAATQAKQNAVYLWVVPGFTVMFAFFLISVMARSFIIERDQGTLRRLLMAPIGSVPVLIGKTMPYYLTSVLQCTLLFLCGRVLFGMPWGEQPLYLIPVIICTSAAATSLGLLLSTVVNTDQQVSSYGTTLILVLSSVSGCFFPREFFPKAMKQISLFTPHAWSLKAFDAVLTQPTVDLQLIASCCGMLLLFAALFFVTGWIRFRSTTMT